MICLQCGAEFRRGGPAQGKRCAGCVIANRRGECIECGAEIVRLPGQPGQLPKRCDPCWVANKQRNAEAARLRAMADPDRSEKYRKRSREQVARWRADNTDKRREMDRATQSRRWSDPETRLRIKMMRAEKKYGLDSGGYARMLEEQGHACAICRKPFDESRRLAVDHDHKCCDSKTACGSCVRGLLCANCNRGLAAFMDDPAILRVAASYIEEKAK